MGGNYRYSCILGRLSALILITAALCPPQLFAAVTINKQLWTTSGNVNAIAEDASNLYIGGDFTYVGPETGRAVVLDSSNAKLPSAFPYVDGIVDSALPDGSGGWFIVGKFTSVGGVTRNRIAHVLADNTVDSAFDPNSNDDVLAMALSTDGSTLYLGGRFTSIGGEVRNCIAAVNTAAGNTTMWDPGAGGVVHALALSSDDSTLYVGGEFTNTLSDPLPSDPPCNIGLDATQPATIGGAQRNHIAALDTTTGIATGWAPEADKTVRALLVSGAFIYAGGEFTSVNQSNRNRLAAIFLVNGLASPWNPNVDKTVHALEISADGSTLFAGGAFTLVGGQTRHRLAAIDTTSGNATTWTTSANNTIFSLKRVANILYVGGQFTTLRGGVSPEVSRNQLAALDTTDGITPVTDWDANAFGGVNTIAVDGNNVFIGGNFSSIGGEQRNHLAALDKASGTLTAWNPNVDSSVWDLELSATTLYVAGSFTNVDGAAHRYLAAFNTVDGTHITGWVPDPDGAVWSLLVDGNELLVGGNFENIGGQPRSFIAALDTVTANASTWNPAADGRVFDLLLDGNTLYSAGEFSTIGGANRDFVAALDRTTGNATTWDARPQYIPSETVTTTLGLRAHLAVSAPAARGNIRKMVLDGTTLYVGGKFTAIGGRSRNNIAALSSSNGDATDWNPNANLDVISLSLSGSVLLAGGGFSHIGGQFRDNIAALDTSRDSNNASAWNPSASGEVTTMLRSGNELYIGGTFSHLGGNSRRSLAAITLAPTATLADPAGGLYGTSQFVTLSCADQSGNGCSATHFTTDGSDPTTASPMFTAPIEISTDTTLKFFSVDTTNSAEPINSEQYIIDTTPPVTTVSRPGGEFTQMLRVALFCTDDQANNPARQPGCVNTYFTLDGSAPTILSPTFSTGAITIDESTGVQTSEQIASDPAKVYTTTLKFFSTDQVGNSEAINTEIYRLVLEPPTPPEPPEPPLSTSTTADLAGQGGGGGGSSLGPLLLSLCALLVALRLRRRRHI